MISLPGITITRLPLMVLQNGEAVADPTLDAFFNPDESKILGIVPASRHIPTHVEAVQTVLDACQELNQATSMVSCQHFNSVAVLYVHYQLSNIELEYDDEAAEGSYLVPEIIVRNSYDGRIFFGLEFGLRYGDLFFRILTTPALIKQACKKDLLLPQLNEFISVALDRCIVRIEQLCRMTPEEVGLDSTLRTHIRRHWSNRMLYYYERYIGKYKHPTAWDAYTALTSASNLRTSYINKRDTEIALAKHFDMVWHMQFPIHIEE